MKDLLKTGLVLAICFAATFGILVATGLLQRDDVVGWLEFAQGIDPWLVAAIVICLLVADLFIAVPTMTVTLLAGYFLGPIGGALAAGSGMILAGVTGYIISRKFGRALLRRVISDEQRLLEMEDVFSRYGMVVLMICRAMPILPEVSCCLAGVTRMKFGYFGLAYLIGTVPYVIVCSWFGSQSSLANPMPAIWGASGGALVMWSCWFFLIRHHRAQNRKVAEHKGASISG
ncbi:MAG: VTT domain-containing protein [Thalassospira sp.]|uniref:TVP38/TMEM64 family protein n=1 Tax=Thalassospira sp. TaxID=1912094 RepID=UPI0032ED9BD4